MKKHINKIVFALAFLALGSCSEDFFEVEPQEAQTFFDSFYVTESQVFDGLIAAYDPLQYTYINSEWVSTVMLGEIWSDNANAGGDPSNFDRPAWQEIDDYSITPLSQAGRGLWEKYYMGVNRTNQLLNNVKVQSPLVDQYLAEAKFLRAYYNFELVRTFGPMPVVTEILEPDDLDLSRPTLSTVYGHIEKDLLEAIPLLPVNYNDASKAGRVTKGAAQALLGKAYLYWADLLNDDEALFDKAATQLQAVINSGQYQLVDDYNQLFAFGAANTEESVFEIQYTNQVGADWNYGPGISGNMIIMLTGIRGLANHPDYLAGWGFNLPTEDLYDSYLPDDAYRRSGSIVSLADLQADGGSVSMKEQNMIDYTGFWQRKYANYLAYTGIGDPVLSKAANQPVIRYADVLLMAAEALVRGTGDENVALDYINLVRERAKGPGDNAGSYKTAQTIMAEEDWSILELIWYERRAELAGEGDRWFDLVRSGRADVTLFDSGDVRATNFDNNDQYLPIPQNDIDLTGGKLTAYPDASLFQ